MSQESERAGVPLQRVRAALRSVLPTLIIILTIAAARSSLADHYHVPTGSMLPTVEPGDRIVVSKLAFDLKLPFTDVSVARLGDPRPGDVVVVRSPEDGRELLKRVAAGPGQTVEVRAGELFIDGRSRGTDLDRERLSQCVYPADRSAGGGPDYGPVEVPAEHYLLLGDNRGGSHDGRGFGLIPRRLMVGRALAIFNRGVVSWRGFCR